MLTQDRMHIISQNINSNDKTRQHVERKDT